MQTKHQAKVSQLQACSSVLSYVSQVLQGQLRPAMQQLMTGECLSTSSSVIAVARLCMCMRCACTLVWLETLLAVLVTFCSYVVVCSLV
jgi:hypothetical protein